VKPKVQPYYPPAYALVSGGKDSLSTAQVLAGADRLLGCVALSTGIGTPDWRDSCDLTRTALAVQSADIQDEQLAGFGNILNNLVEAINQLRNDITESFKEAAQ
jgi:hypothetical protein